MLESFYDISCMKVANERHIDEKKDMMEVELSKCLADNKISSKCQEFETYSLEEFRTYATPVVEEFANGRKFTNIPLLIESYFYYLSVKIITRVYTGLVFVGYGEDEIYPSLIPLVVSPLVVEDCLKYYIDENNHFQISEHGTTAVICPFAQTDVIQTIVRGINPSFQDIIASVTKKSMKSIIDAVVTIINANPAMSHCLIN